MMNLRDAQREVYNSLSRLKTPSYFAILWILSKEVERLYANRVTEQWLGLMRSTREALEQQAFAEASPVSAREPQLLMSGWMALDINQDLPGYLIAIDMAYIYMVRDIITNRQDNEAAGSIAFPFEEYYGIEPALGRGVYRYDAVEIGENSSLAVALKQILAMLVEIESSQSDISRTRAVEIGSFLSLGDLRKP